MEFRKRLHQVVLATRKKGHQNIGRYKFEMKKNKKKQTA